jgi:hypothetical protein
MSLDCIQAVGDLLRLTSPLPPPDDPSLGADVVSPPLRNRNHLPHLLESNWCIQVLWLSWLTLTLRRLNGKSPKAVCVQYLHFASTIGSDGGEVILDGQENASSLSASSQSIPPQAAATAKIRSLLSLNDAAIFSDTCLPIGTCRS